VLYCPGLAGGWRGFKPRIMRSARRCFSQFAEQRGAGQAGSAGYYERAWTDRNCNQNCNQNLCVFTLEQYVLTVVEAVLMTVSQTP